MPREIRHRHNQPEAPHVDVPGAFALHLPRLRRLSLDKSLTQEELAKMVGVTDRFLRRVEHAKKLPRPVEAFLAIAAALEVHVEELVAPKYLAGLHDRVERLRAAVEHARHLSAL